MSTETLTTPGEVKTAEHMESRGEHPADKPRKKPPNRRRRKIIGRFIWLGVFLLFAGGIAFAIWKLFFTPKPVFYDTAFVYNGMLESTAMGYGYVRPAETADVAVVQSGIVLESLVFEGDRVEEGDLLYILDSKTLDDAIETLEKEIEVIEKNIETQEKFIEEKEKANTDIREGHLRDASAASVRAPFTGKLTGSDINLKVGDLVPSQLGTLIDDATMLLTLYYSYAYENEIAVGMPAKISISANMSLVDGYVKSVEKVRRIMPDGTVSFEVEFAMRNPGALAKDMMASAQLISVSGEEILPTEAGSLRNNCEMVITPGLPGNIGYINMRDYHTYQEGTLLCRVEYDADNSGIEANNKQISEARDVIEKYNEDIHKKRGDIADKEEDYEHLRKTAPISGTVMFNRLVVGERADPGQTVISIAKMDKMVIEAQIDERNIGGVSVGNTVQLEQWTYDGIQYFVGIVESVSFEAKMDGSYVYFPAIISADNYGGNLLQNMSVQFTMTLEQRFGILVAPVNAVKNTPEGMVVFVKSDVRPDNAVDMPPEIIVPPGFHAVPVQTGMATAFGVEIISGIEEGAEVFTQELEYDPNAGGMYGGGGGGIVVGRW